MTQSKVDWPSLLFTLAFSTNLIIGFFDPIELFDLKEMGEALFIGGMLLFGYVLLYLRSGFFGDTKPKLDFLITNGPYRFCRHPLYLSFFIIILGIDLMLRSVLGLVVTFLFSVPSIIYRAKTEDELLRKKFSTEWENYAEKVGLLFPKIR